VTVPSFWNAGPAAAQALHPRSLSAAPRGAQHHGSPLRWARSRDDLGVEAARPLGGDRPLVDCAARTRPAPAIDLVPGATARRSRHLERAYVSAMRGLNRRPAQRGVVHGLRAPREGAIGLGQSPRGAGHLSTPAGHITSAAPVWTSRAPDPASCPDRRAGDGLAGHLDRRPPAGAHPGTLRLSSPNWLAQPNTTSSTSAAGTPARSTASLMTSAARSSGRRP